ncbi:MAG TPA: laccase domain-containing protein, partial [Thermoanaerobaculia bacterium]
MAAEWSERSWGGQLIFEPANVPSGLRVAFSGRGITPANEPSPTSYLARRFADALDLDGTPIVRATQVHGKNVSIVREPPAARVSDAGACDVLATALPGVAIAVQTADCVSILLAGENGVAAAHAGWRGTAQETASAAVAALRALGERPETVRAWLGPSIGACCYEVGAEVSDRFSEEFLRPGTEGRFFLDLAAANRAQLVA